LRGRYPCENANLTPNLTLKIAYDSTQKNKQIAYDSTKNNQLIDYVYES
jgi:hypothetical protein